MCMQTFIVNADVCATFKMKIWTIWGSVHPVHMILFSLSSCALCRGNWLCLFLQWDFASEGYDVAYGM